MGKARVFTMGSFVSKNTIQNAEITRFLLFL